MRKLTLLLMATIVTLCVNANPANPGLVQMPQPDGTMLSVRLVGDEFYHFNTTADDYTIMLNEQGAYVYAQRDGMKLVATDVLAHDEGNRSAAELALLASTPKRIVDGIAVGNANIRRAKRNVDLSNFDFENFRGLVILIDFADRKFAAEDPQAFYTEMFSTENLTGFHDPVKDQHVNCLGSVRDYFRDQSNGAFNPPFDVYGPYTSTRNANQCSDPTTVFTTALKKANDDVDYTIYDNNNDGMVDMVYFLVAGYSAASNGESTGYLWPHASSLFYRRINYDGKWIDRYASSTELYGWENSPSTVTVEGIGTVCHEFSHVLGLPDFYDTDYSESGGESHHPGEWDVMAGGADFNYGRTPVGYTLYERYALGWANPKTITSPGSYSVGPVNETRDGFILRSPVNNEFFMIENRQKTSWDSYLPGHGMIVSRVDSTNSSIWSNNKVNCNPNHNYFELLRAGNSTIGDKSSDPFPGSSGNPMITNDTYPGLRTWNGTANPFNIVGIKEQDNIISFTVVNDGDIQCLVENFEGMPVTTTTNETEVEGEFANWSFVKAGVRAPGQGKADGTNSVMMKPPSQLYSTTPIYYNCYLASLNVYNTSSSVARFSLDYSIDGGETWVKASNPIGGTYNEVAKNTTATCYWALNLNNHQGALFRIYQSATKDKTTYIDNFSIFYTGEEGGPIDNMPGDVNGDKEVNVADADVVINIILGGTDNTEGRSDVNGDKEVNVADVNAIIDIILKK